MEKCVEVILYHHTCVQVTDLLEPLYECFFLSSETICSKRSVCNLLMSETYEAACNILL